MKKMGQQLRDRLLLQAEEAKAQGIDDLMSGVWRMVIATDPENKYTDTFNHDELSLAVQRSLWEATGKIATYHDLSMIDIQKMRPLIAEAAEKFINQIECSCDVENKLGPFEETVPGQASNQ